MIDVGSKFDLVGTKFESQKQDIHSTFLIIWKI